jgi:hypothetical protein
MQIGSTPPFPPLTITNSADFPLWSLETIPLFRILVRIAQQKAAQPPYNGFQLLVHPSLAFTQPLRYLSLARLLAKMPFQQLPFLWA